MMGGSEAIDQIEAREQLDWLCNRLARMRLPLEDEKALQAVIAERLENYGVGLVREMPVTGGVIDFFVPVIGAGIEVKIKGAGLAIRRQLAGYADDARIAELVLVTAKPVALPETIGRRRRVPVTLVDISRGWL